MALVITIGGEVSEYTKEHSHDLLNSLEWLHQQVGGYLECFTFRNPVSVNGKIYHAMMLNENGKIEGLPVNDLATSIAIGGGLVGDIIVGDVILFANGEID